MKRLGVISLAVGVLVAFQATVAIAQYPPSRPAPTPTGGGSPGDVAFTGANIGLGLILLVALVVIGAILMVASRRRRTPTP